MYRNDINLIINTTKPLDILLMHIKNANANCISKGFKFARIELTHRK